MTHNAATIALVAVVVLTVIIYGLAAAGKFPGGPKAALLTALIIPGVPPL